MQTPPPLPASRPRLPRAALAGMILSGVLYLVSLGLPVLVFEGHEPVNGAGVLASGWMGPFAGGQFAWYANPFYLAAIVFTLLRMHSLALGFALAAVGIALTSPQSHTWYFNESVGTPIAGLGSAFPAWLSAIVIAAGVNGAVMVFSKRR